MLGLSGRKGFTLLGEILRFQRLKTGKNLERLNALKIEVRKEAGLGS